MTAGSEQNDQNGTTQPTQKNVDGQPVIVTVRMITDGKEVGSIIGKKGDNVKRYREVSGAKINISDASCAERIVTLTGMLEQIRVAFQLMCIKFEDDLRANTNPGSTLPPVNVRLVIPASQCGSLIGKQGAKIKELKETTGACVSVSNEMLPGSTERVVTITGSSTSISNCVTEVCSIMLESPPKGATLPYRPKPTLQNPIMYGMTAAYGLPGQAQSLPGQAPNIAGQPTALPMTQHIPGTLPGVSYAPTSTSEAGKMGGPQSPVFSMAGMTVPSAQSLQTAQLPNMSQGAPLIVPNNLGTPYNPYAGMPGMPLTQLNAMNSYLGGVGRTVNNNILGMALQTQQPASTQSSEMVIPNELIGCIIGRGGAKINEIRQLSGAQIKISNCEEGTNDRKVTITGYPDNIAMATYLINTSVEIHKAQLLMSTAAAGVDATNVNCSAAATVSMPAVQASVTPTSVTPAVSQSQLSSTTYSQLYPTLKQVSPTAISQTGFPAVYGLQANYALGTATYDPKAYLNAATSNKLKILPAPTGVKLDQRFAPY